MAQNKTTEHAAPRGMRLRPPPENTRPGTLPKRLRPWVSRLVIVLLAAPLSLMVSAQAAFAEEPPPAGQEGTTLEDVSVDAPDVSPAQDPASEQGEDGPAEGEGAEPTDSNTGSEPSGGVPAAEEPVEMDNDPGPPSPRLLWGKTTVLQTALRVSPDASPGGVPEIHLGEVSPGENVSFVLVAKNFSNTTIGSKSAPGHSRIVSEIGATLDEVSASCAPYPANANVRCLPSTDILPGNVVQQNWDGGKNGTIQLTVNGTLPAGTPPGEYSIRSFLPSNFENNSMNSPKPFTTSGLKTVGKAGDIREATVRFTVPVAEQVADAVLSVDPEIRVADGSDAHTARVSVENQAGEPMSGVEVVFRGAPELKLPTMPVTTNIEGIAKVAITSTVAGTHELEALINGNPVAGSPARVSFGPGSPSVGEHGKSSLAVSEGTRVADGVEQHSATATVVDAQGNPVPGLRVDFSLPPRATAKLNSSFATTNAEGKATVTATSTVAGTTAVTAKLGNSTLRNSPSEVTFVAGKPSLGAKGQSRLSATTGDQFADGSARHTVTATVLDANKNPVGATEVHFSVPAASGASLSHAVVTTDPQGVATVSVTSSRAGKVPVSATVGSTALKNSPVQLSFVAKTGDPSVGKKGKSSLTVSGGDKVADGKQAHTATATVLDAKKRPVAGATVQFAVPGNSGASLSATKVKTNAQGVATVSVTSVTAGNVKVSATVNGTNLRKSPGTVSFVAGDPSVGKKGTSSLKVSGGDKVADGKQSHTATATVLDANKNPVAGATVTFSVPSTSGASLSATNVKTNAQGVATVTVTSVTAGNVKVSATVNGTSLRKSPGTVSFVAGDPSVGKKGTSSLRVSGGDKVADGKQTHTATATVLDANRNPVAGATVTFSVPSTSGASLSATSAKTNAQGVATVSVTATKAGKVPVTATVAGAELRQSPGTVSFVAGDPSVGKKGTSSLRVSGGDKVADGKQAHTATARVLDANKNPVAGVLVTFSVPTESGASLSQTSARTNAQGIATVSVTATKAGKVPVTATVSGTNLRQSPGTVSFVAGDPSVGKRARVPCGSPAGTGSLTASSRTPRPRPSSTRTKTRLRGRR